MKNEEDTISRITWKIKKEIFLWENEGTIPFEKKKASEGEFFLYLGNKLPFDCVLVGREEIPQEEEEGL